MTFFSRFLSVSRVVQFFYAALWLLAIGQIFVEVDSGRESANRIGWFSCGTLTFLALAFLAHRRAISKWRIILAIGLNLLIAVTAFLPLQELDGFERNESFYYTILSNFLPLGISGSRDAVVAGFHAVAQLTLTSFLIGSAPFARFWESQPSPRPESLGAQIDAFDLLERLPNKRRFIMIHLHNRMQELSLRASWVLVLMLALLVLAVTVIIFAGQITFLDTRASNLTQELVRERENLQSRVDRLRGDRLKVKSELYTGITLLRSFGVEYIQRSALDYFLPPGFDLEKFFKDLTATNQIRPSPEQGEGAKDGEEILTIEDATRQMNLISSAPERIKDLDEQISSALARRAAINTVIDQGIGARIAQTTPDAKKDSSFLIAAGITRFGIVAIIVYIIQILVTLYKYNMRMRAFYFARFNTIAFLPENSTKMDGLIASFSPEGISFGRTPDTPIKDIADAITAAVGRAIPGKKDK